jgi:hypothetical protein
MPEWWMKPVRSPYLWLIIGVFSIFSAAFFTYTGRVRVRFTGWVYRDREPEWFWWQVLLYCLVGVVCVGFFLCLSARV